MQHTEIITCGENPLLIQHLLSCNVEFLVVGGAAVAFYGCRSNDDVDDLDIMLRPTVENMNNFFKAADAFGMTTPWTAEELARPAVHLPIKNFLYIDILTPPKQYDFQNLIDSSLTMLLNGYKVRVISKTDLIKLKQDTISSNGQNHAKHSKDLHNLLGA
jgi:predicted nucleotidyltransferase